MPILLMVTQAPAGTEFAAGKLQSLLFVELLINTTLYISVVASVT